MRKLLVLAFVGVTFLACGCAAPQPGSMPTQDPPFGPTVSNILDIYQHTPDAVRSGADKMISIGAASSQRENGVPTKDCPHVRIHQFTGPVVIELLTKRVKADPSFGDLKIGAALKEVLPKPECSSS